MTRMMKAVIKSQPGPGAELARVPVPEIGPRDVLVRVKATSICGTDYHIYSWDQWSAGRIKPPLVLGHEFSGEVVAVGPEVTSVAVGDMVSAETHIVCGTCALCRTGQAHICQNTRILGVDTNGAFAEFVSIPEANAWKNDPALPPEMGSIQEPLGNAVHTALAGEIAGQTVAVVGCGPIGLMSLGVALACGAGAVFAVDINEYRMELASRLGATAVIDARSQDTVKVLRGLTGGLGVDAVLEMSGHPDAIRQSLKAVRNGGRVSLLGLPSKPLELDLTKDVIFKGITLQGIAGRRMFQTWFQVRALLASGRLNMESVITHRMPLEDFAEGMGLMRSGNCGRVVLFP